MGTKEKLTCELERGAESAEDLCFIHYPRVLQLCRFLLVDPQEAEEIAQEVFLNLVRAQPTQMDIRSWEAWFTRVTVNACRNRRRSWWWRWWRDEHVEYQEEQIRSAGDTPEEDVCRREERERLWQALQALSRRQREVFTLNLEGWSQRMTAEILGISVGSVKRHLFHAIRHLRRQLGEHP